MNLKKRIKFKHICMPKWQSQHRVRFLLSFSCWWNLLVPGAQIAAVYISSDIYSYINVIRSTASFLLAITAVTWANTWTPVQMFTTPAHITRTGDRTERSSVIQETGMKTPWQSIKMAWWLQSESLDAGFCFFFSDIIHCLWLARPLRNGSLKTWHCSLVHLKRK